MITDSFAFFRLSFLYLFLPSLFSFSAPFSVTHAAKLGRTCLELSFCRPGVKFLLLFPCSKPITNCSRLVLVDPKVAGSSICSSALQSYFRVPQFQRYKTGTFGFGALAHSLGYRSFLSRSFQFKSVFCFTWLYMLLSFPFPNSLICWHVNGLSRRRLLFPAAYLYLGSCLGIQLQLGRLEFCFWNLDPKGINRCWGWCFKEHWINEIYHFISFHLPVLWNSLMPLL